MVRAVEVLVDIENQRKVQQLHLILLLPWVTVGLKMPTELLVLLVEVD
jgi:hypothetical protein|tara:strand:- start:379 stop:522 length:144 start_codon:yes stop_codon:yes gene_type:complete